MTSNEKWVSREQLEAQEDYTRAAAALLKERSERPLAYVETYGCQQNESDSELLRGMLREMGCAMTEDSSAADVAVVNTCAIREHAQTRVFGNIGALGHGKKSRPGQIIAVCGCMAQQEQAAQKLKNSYPYVDIVFGTHALWRFPELLYQRLIGRKRVFCVTGEEGSVAEGLPRLRDSRVKAWVSIMYGCNNFCSYCVVPYVRGRERSRRPEDILAEVEALAADGCRDITLLGQNVNSYGRDLGGAMDFGALLREIDRIPGDFLVRFMTSHPKDAGESLFSAMAGCQKAAPHIHLPFQSGSSRVLSAMNRGYTREQYIAKAAMGRKYIPGLTLTSDVIVGFPGETEEEFKETLSLIEELEFHALFTFIFSPRPGTPAASMPDGVSREEKQERFDRLLRLQNSISARLHGQLVGQTLRVLVDGPNQAGDQVHSLSSRTASGRLVHLQGGPELIGSYVNAEITGSTTWSLLGRAVK